MTGQEAIDSFRIYFDRVTSFSAPGYLDAEILLFLNNAQDQFVKDKVFGKNFQPPAFEDNQKRVVDILPLVYRALISFAQINANTLYGASAYSINKTGIAEQRMLYILQLELQVTRTNPTLTDEYLTCKPIKSAQIGNFTQGPANRTHFLYPKYVEDLDKIHVICDYYSSSVSSARISVVRRPYPITDESTEYDGTYGSTVMNLHTSVHQEVVDIAVEQALQAISDPRWQTKISQEQISTN